MLPDRTSTGIFRQSLPPTSFHLVKWEFKALGGEIGQFFSRHHESTDNATSEFATYFDNVEQIRTLEATIEAVKAGDQPGDLPSLEDKLSVLRQDNSAMTGDIERQLEKKIKAMLSQEGIFNPLDKYVRFKIGFPPVKMILAKPPHLLVVSPRDRIESIREVNLLPEMSQEDMESIEAKVDSLGVSSLVVDLGGLATYPSYITDEADLQFIIETAVHEWLHQYLAFTPLGFYYILDLTGIRQDYDIATINETVVSMVSKEIGSMIYKEYFAQGETDNTRTGIDRTGL